MRKMWIPAAALLLIAASYAPAKADDQGSLAFELTALREAWLYGDDATAAARLDTLRKDNRISGEFPRWYSSLRAILALRANDKELALETLQPVLEESTDPRNYLRACRLLLAYDDADSALTVIRAGLEKAPDSRALLRYEAGLLWLNGDHNAALDAYIKIIATGEQVNYPYVNADFIRWSESRPWNADEIEKPKPNEAEEELDRWFGEPEAKPGEYKPEPYTSLFLPIHWFPSDLPGLDRCVVEVASDETLGAEYERKLGELVTSAKAAQQEVDNLRSGDAEQRKELEAKAETARWKALFAARIAATRQLDNEELDACAKSIKDGLALSTDDIPLLDLQAQLYGRRGQAEEARNGPLAKLRTIANIAIYPSTLYAGGVRSQVVDRVFMPALTLYRANPEAGQIQFDLMRTSFGDSNRKQPIYAGVLGLWLFKQGETEYARKLLVEASRLNGHESGRPLYDDALFVEMALLAMGEGKIEEPGERPAPGPGEEEVDPVEMAKLDANTNPLLRQSLRVGSVLSAVQDPRERVRTYSGVDLWGGFAGFDSVVLAARYTGEENLLQSKLFDLANKIAADVPDAELDAFLADDHTTSTTLKEALNSLKESLESLRANNNWNVRRAVSQQAGPVFGMVEARSILLRAKLIKDKPATLAELTTWLDKHQPQIDLRARLGAQPSEVYARFTDARKSAGIPEVVHKGLVIDAAKLLSAGGNHADAAKLLWFNRDAVMGVESTQHLLAVGAALADKGGEKTLAIRCRVTSASENPNPMISSGVNMPLLLAELPGTQDDLTALDGDVTGYLENHIIPWADSGTMHELYRIVPNLAEQRPTLVMRNTSRTGTEGIFASSVSSGTCVVIWRNWAKMMVSKDTWDNCHRFAAWVIASDLPVGLTRNYHNGLASEHDTVMGWAMLNELWKKQGANNPEALQARDKLGKLLDRTAAQPGHRFDIYSNWWN